MVAECFKKVIEYITMTAEVWFSFVIDEWPLFLGFCLALLGSYFWWYSVSFCERCIGNAI